MQVARPFSWCLLLVCLPQMTLAQARPPDRAPRLEETIVRASRLGPASSVASHAALPGDSSDTLPMLPSDLLRAVPGAFAQQTTPGQGMPIVRGLKGSQVLHLVDGFRLNNAIFRSAPNQYLALVPTAAVARIDLARGAVGTLYGSDAMGGVVQLSTRQPRFDQALRFGGSLGWLGSSRAVSTVARARAGSTAHAFEAGVAHDDVGDRRIGGGERIAPSAYESRSAWLRTRHRWDEGEWGVNAQFVEQPSVPRIDELVPGFGQSTPAASEFLFAPNRREFLQLHASPAVRGKLADALQLQLGWQRIIDDRRVREFASAQRTWENNSSEMLGLSVTASRELDSGHRLRYGLDASTDEVRSGRVREDIATGLRERVAARFPDGSRMDSVGLFADYLWQPLPDTTLELGLRYSRFRIAIPATPFGGEAATLKPDDVSARLGLRQVISPALALSANIAQGFRAPNVFDLSALGPRPGNRFSIANPDLAPERILSADVGLVAESGAARLGATLFYSDYRDRITSVLTGEETAAGRLVVSSENIGAARIYGAEAFVAYNSDGALAVDATLNWTWGEDREGGDTVPADRIPPLNGRVRMRAPMDGWTLEAVVLLAAAQERLSPRDVRDPRIDPSGSAGWVAVNLRARRELGASVLTVGLDNLFDRRYREHGSGIDAPGRGLVLQLELPLGGP